MWIRWGSICVCVEQSTVKIIWDCCNGNCRAKILYSTCSIDHKTTISSYDTIKVWMYHPKGEINVSVIIVYVHKAWNQTETSTNERYPWYIWYAYLWRSYIVWYTKEDVDWRARDEVKHFIVLWMDDRALHGWIHETRPSGILSWYCRVCR